MKVAAIQHDIAWQDPAATHARLEPMIAQAAAGGARLIVLSEMYATGFSMHPEEIAEEPGGPNERFLIEQAARHGAWLIGSIAQWSDPSEAELAEAERRRAALPDSEPTDRLAANVAVVAGPSGELHRFNKIHPFSYAGEHEHYRAGTEFLTVEIEELRVSVFICYDLRFADEFWALAADTDLYVVPANWPEQRREHWRALLRARAIENQAYVLGCNRVGDAQRLSHSGDSTIIDPLGRTLTEASYVESVLIADVEAAEVQRVRKRYPFLADRR